MMPTSLAQGLVIHHPSLAISLSLPSPCITSHRHLQTDGFLVGTIQKGSLNTALKQNEIA